MGYHFKLERQKENVGMHNIIENIKSASIVWYWSLKPGRFVNETTGENPYPDSIALSWRGTIEEWNQNVVSLCLLMTHHIESEENYVFHMPDTIFSKLTSSMMEKLTNNGNKIKRNNEVPYNMVCVVSGDKSGLIKVLNINEKGNLI